MLASNTGVLIGQTERIQTEVSAKREHKVGRKIDNQDIRVLLVEDNSGDARLVEDMLFQAGGNRLELTCVDRLEPALERLGQKQFDVILLCLSLSNGQVLNVITKLHAQLPKAPIVILTSLQQETLAREIVRESAQGYLVMEQLNGDLLIRAVCSAIERQGPVTDLKQEIRELQSSQAYFRNIITKNADGMVIVDKNGIIRFANPSAEEIFGRKIDKLIGELFGFPIVAGETTELDIVRRGRQAITVEMRVVEIEWEGQVIYLATLRDVTEHKRLLAELEQTRRQQLEMKGQFISRVSHELRSPLAAIHQFVTILLDRLAGDISSEQREYLEIVLRNVNQLRTMVGDLLEVNRTETGRLVVSPRHVSLAELIMEIVEASKLTLTKAVSLSADIPSDLPPICADPDRVREIMTNLLDNAVKFTPENGAVSVRAEVYNKDSNFLCVAVSDTGCGISCKENERIFEYLYQGERNTEASRKGLGLGLYICKELVRRHGGRIWVESELGHGSTFFFTLPVFSVEQLLSPILTETNLQIGTTAIITVEIFPDEKRGLTEADEAALQDAWNVIHGCILPSKDVLLPMTPYTGVGKVFYVVLHADRRGAEALVLRIREHLERCEALRSSGLQLVISINIPEIPLGESKKPTKESVKKLADQIEELMKATVTKG